MSITDVQAVLHDSAGELLIVFALSFVFFLFVLRPHEVDEDEDDHDQELEDLRTENAQLKDELHAMHLRNFELVRIMNGKCRRELPAQASEAGTPTRPVPASAVPQCAGPVSPIEAGMNGARAASARGTRARERTVYDNTGTPGRSSTDISRYPGPSWAKHPEAPAKAKHPEARAKHPGAPAKAARAQKLSSGALFYSQVVQRQLKGVKEEGVDHTQPPSWHTRWQSLPHQQLRGETRETAQDPRSPCSTAAAQGAQRATVERSSSHTSSMRDMAVVLTTPVSDFPGTPMGDLTLSFPRLG